MENTADTGTAFVLKNKQIQNNNKTNKQTSNKTPIIREQQPHPQSPQEKRFLYRQYYIEG